jgi:MFS family permease
VGDGVGNVALVIYIQERRGTGSAVGLLLLVVMLPSVLAPITGVVADRFDRRSVLVACELVQAAVGLVIVVWLPDLGPLLVLVFLKSIAATVSDTAGRSALPALVRDDDLVAANAWFGGVRQGAEVIGPLAGGVLVALAGIRPALVVDLATFLVAVPLFLRLPRLALARTEPRGSWLSDARAGLRFLVHHRIAGALAVAFTAADDVALPFLARELGAGDAGIGVLYAAVAVGLVIGFAAIARGRFPIRPALGFVAGCAVVGIGEIFTGLAPAIALAVAFQIVRGIGTAAIDANLQTLLQRTVPPELLGRVFANVYGAVGVAAALSVAVAGPLLDTTSPATVLVLAGVAALVAAAGSALLFRAYD